jgi:asparagine synthase (glutamine-hydrolysing)
MCGIAGVFGKTDPEQVKTMLLQLVHRGPDDGLAVPLADSTLGARRLSIIDIADGKQPLANTDESIWAAQNGELYNFQVLREELISKGHKLRTKCDTEVLPYLYQEYGTNLVNKLDGMFAISIWDSRNKTGILARDRMGKKPLYYFEESGLLYYASEIKALLSVSGFKRRLNFEALDYYLSYKHIPSPLTIFDGIHVLPPGHLLTYNEGRVAISKYWDFDFSSNDFDQSDEEVADTIDDLLRKATERRLMSDVPIGFFLSGGLDSSLSTAYAAQVSPEKIKTFTLTYKANSTQTGKELDRYWARHVAKQYGTQHHEEQVSFDDFQTSIRRIIGCFDEPFCGTISTYFISALMSKHVSVALSGDGADELFGSYLSHRLATPIANHEEFLKTGDKSLIAPFESDAEYVGRMAKAQEHDWKSTLFVYSDHEKSRLFSTKVSKEKYGNATKLLAKEFTNLTATEPLNRVLEAEYRTIFPDQVLTFIDRLSMAHSLEVRSPYLDTALVQYVSKLPDHLKIRNGQTKFILKQLALRYFPQEMVMRPKEGFIMPVTSWLLGPLEEYVRHTLSSEQLNKHGLFNTKMVSKLVDGLYESSDHHYSYVNKILSLVIFQEWYELYMTQSPITSYA